MAEVSHGLHASILALKCGVGILVGPRGVVSGVDVV